MWSFNGNVKVHSFYWKQKVCSVNTKNVPMGGLYDDCCFQWEITGIKYFARCGLLVCSMGNMVCSTGIMDVLILMGNYWCAQQELIIFSNGHYWGLCGKLLCAQLDIGGVLNRKLLVCIL